MKLLFVAADKMEYSGILTHLQEAEEMNAGMRWVRAGRLGDHRVLLTANGVGWKRAAAATEKGCAALGPDAIISTGFCGALAEDLRVADIVSATAVNGYPARVLTGAISSRQGSVCSIDHIARTAAEKARLGRSGACAVEMEAQAVAEHARAHGAPFYCVRAVTDLAGEDIANDFDSALRPDGHFDTIHILTGALGKPAVRLPELLRLRGRCIRAATRLGDFFADCRF